MLKIEHVGVQRGKLIQSLFQNISEKESVKLDEKQQLVREYFPKLENALDKYRTVVQNIKVTYMARGCTPRVKRIAYLTLVKPVMTYGLPAWHPGTQENVQKLERVQRRAMHFVYGRNLPEPREQNVMPFDMHLRYTDLIFFKKCLSGQTDFDARARISEGRVLRGDDNRHPRLQQPPARTECGRSAFSYRVVAPWNNLPPALKDCTTDQFPSLCVQHLWVNFNV